MKKIIAILVLCCYVAGVLGIDISLHYCGGSFHSINFALRDDNGCCGKKKKKMRCCKDRNLSYKLSEKHAAQHMAHNHAAGDLVAILPVHTFAYPNYIFTGSDSYIPVSHAPPDIPKPRLHLLHGVFLI